MKRQSRAAFTGTVQFIPGDTAYLWPCAESDEVTIIEPLSLKVEDGPYKGASCLPHYKVRDLEGDYFVASQMRLSKNKLVSHGGDRRIFSRARSD